MTKRLPRFVFLVIFLALVVNTLSFAQSHFDFTPSIAVSETYDDNIYLDPDHETSDYITTVTPRISLALVKQYTRVELAYAPSFVWYQDEDDNNTTRHTATLTFGQQLGSHLRFDLTDTFYRSEEPIEETEGIVGVRHTRRSYKRNSGEASLSYQFGPDNHFSLGYRQSYLENDDPDVDDGREQSPFADVIFWINEANGIELGYEYTKADFWRERGEAGDDYTGNSASITYLHRFGPHITISLGYTYTDRDFDGDTEDYKIHEGNFGYEQSFSPNLSLSLGIGYFVQDNDVSDNEKGYSYDLSVTRRIGEYTSMVVGGAGGWNEAYLEAERRGFSKYWSGNARIERQILEPLSLYFGGSYRKDKDDTGRTWRTTRGNVGLRYSFLRWFSAGLEYAYAKRDDDVNADDYTNNRVMFTVSASKLIRW
ncbi:MAG: outer membrane beta-barrel protein [Deltaproteobacteria bacterium]|nr:outer membrane beta-barrel protein [Deltaproteobacteria bacterium]MBW1929187.1 outer membrane beta-barrel protein [Deltaproteobacteria bacterium]MBW2127038.1 outer membrane beta-barrel protein [Deltaproteobacteria bacterium]